MWQPDPRFGAPSYPKGGVAPLRHDLAVFNCIQNARARSTGLRGARSKAESAAASIGETRHGRVAFRFTAVLGNKP